MSHGRCSRRSRPVTAARSYPSRSSFGALLAEHGTLGPAEVPAKRSYLLKDVYRKAHRAAVPFVLPPTHPFNPLLALRVASLPMDEGSRRKLVDALFTATWGNGRGVESPEAVAHAASAGGLDGDALVRAAQAPEAKARLRAQTDEAIAADVFGVPTVAVDGELFWGVDSLEALDAFLEGRDPVPGELVAAWDALPSSVTRRGE